MVGAAADTEAVAEGTEAAEVTGPRAENHCQSHSFADCGFEGVYYGRLQLTACVAQVWRRRRWLQRGRWRRLRRRWWRRIRRRRRR